VDWRTYHAVNRFVAEHSWLGRVFQEIETYGTVLIGVAAVLLWLAARPGGSRKWKLASASALAAAALGLLVNRLVAAAWHRDRPYETHHVAHIWGPHKSDPSFPSDHASAATAIAVAVLLFDPIAGALFAVVALLIGVGRVIVGEHYPGDVLGGALIGATCALLVVLLARRLIHVLVQLVERVTDPHVNRLWRKRVTGS
jgi:undecaprenyl-diphosphatase